MKDSGSLIRGRLRADAYPAFADYLLRFADDYARAGVPLYALTMQNEPATEPPNYPGMRFGARARARFIAEALGPRLARRPDAPRLLDWDHNWDAPESPLAVLADPAAAAFVAGVAWHCYAGKPEAQGVVHAAHPDKDTYLTECSGGGWSPEWSVALRFLTGTVLIDGMRQWARGAILWNIALDERHGPHLGGCTNCRGVVTVDSTSGEVTRNVEYYALGHVSRFIRPGAIRIESTSEAGGLRTVAFQNTDDGSIALVVCNDGADAQFTVRMAGRSVRYALAGGDVATLTWLPRP
jgi:glucosylceramidase